MLQEKKPCGTSFSHDRSPFEEITDSDIEEANAAMNLIKENDDDDFLDIV